MISLTVTVPLPCLITSPTGDVVSVVLPTGPHYPVVVLGGAGAGCRVSPLNSAYTSTELAGLLSMANTK